MFCGGIALPRRIALVLIAICAVTACGQLGPGAPSPSGMTITLTATACTLDGAGALLPGHFEAKVVNKSSSVAAFNFRRMVDGHAYAELDLFIRQRQQRIAAGNDRPDVAELALPPWTTLQAQRFVRPGQTDTFEADLISGVYGLVCRGDSTANKDLTEAIYVLGPYRVV